LQEVSRKEERPAVELLILAVTSPVKVAVYEKGRCIETWEREGKCSEVLPPLLHDVLYGYRLKAIYYANGPGSFMAIKNMEPMPSRSTEEGR